MENKKKKNSQLRDIVRRFFKNPAAIIGLVLGAILVGGLFLLGGTVLQQLEMTGEQLPLWEELLGGYGIP